MQSEHRCGNYPWGSTEGYVTHQTNQSPTDTAPNDFAYGQETWDLMVDWISRGVNIYSAWNMILDTHGTNLDNVRVWNQNALLIVDRDAGELIATPAYYVFRHLAQYVEPEAVRVAIDGNALAFKNPNGSVVAIMRTSSAGAQTVSIDGTLLQFEASGNGWVTVNWPG
jgi:glucosylceramidase